MSRDKKSDDGLEEKIGASLKAASLVVAEFPADWPDWDVTLPIFDDLVNHSGMQRTSPEDLVYIAQGT